jgi:uncharacterized membrane protein
MFPNMRPSQIFLLYLFLFLAGSVIGYALEVLFRRFFTARKWVNPGFMRGPYLPLYGFGVIIMFSMVMLLLTSLPSWHFYNPLGYYDFLSSSGGASVADLLPIAVMAVSMVALEFVAGLIFVKGFKVKLWDYTNMKGNVMGIICPQFNLIWFALAVIFYYGLNPFVYKAALAVSDYMFGTDGGVAHFGFIFSMGLIYGMMLIDFIASTQVFTRVRRFAVSSGLASRYDDLRLKYKEGAKLAKEKFQEALPKEVKEALAKEKEKARAGDSVSEKASSWFAKFIFIDPSKAKDASNNYDSNGRPKPMDKERKEKTL